MTISFDTPLEQVFRLPPKRKAGLNHLGVRTVRDLLYHFPHRYEKPAIIQTVAETNAGDYATIEGKILSIEAKKTWKTKKPIAEAIVEDVGSTRANFSSASEPNPVLQAASRRGEAITEKVGLRREKFVRVRSLSHIRAIWFHQPYVARQFPPGTFVRLTGKVTKYKNKLTMINPIHERINYGSSTFNVGRSQSLNVERIPIYPETYGVSSLWIHPAIENVFSQLPADAFNDPLPEDVRQRYHLPSLKRALEAIHLSQNEKEAEGARKRFAFEEIFFIQLSRVAMRNERNAQGAAIIKIDGELFDAFRKSLPFALTGAQERVIGELCKDLKGVPRPLGAATAFFNGSDGASPKMPDEAKQLACVPMSRLLQGDVGSGKTLVAATATLHVANSGCQTAYMAPTEILARQHFAEFCKRLGPFGARMGLLTSSEALIFPSKAYPHKPAHLSKQQLFKKIKEGLVDIVIGTHALIANGGLFKNLAFVIVDEQHRFGINQRAMLANRKSQIANRDDQRLAISAVPHYLSMTATPIPRTLALTIYGDLDLSLLDEMPPGRTRVQTKILKPSERDYAYQCIVQEIIAGHQAFVICPRIEEDDESGMRAVQGEYRHLRNHIFPDHEIGILHGKLTPKEKECAMNAFRENRFPILIATTVVEVGIDIPNATVMLIEGAERFGLAQLHQLRGRIARSSAATGALCLAIPGSSSKFTKERLAAFANLADGFALAEQDLQLRGPGELSGVNQWGISDVGMEALRNIKMVETARNEAQRILAEDPHLNHYPQLKKSLSYNRGVPTHLE